MGFVTYLQKEGGGGVSRLVSEYPFVVSGLASKIVFVLI